MNSKENSLIMGIDRHRFDVDGKGIVSLVTFFGCPLSCRYCMNSFCNKPETKKLYIPPEKLVKKLSVDDIYFSTSGGGVVFGGGEPLLNTEYLKETLSIMPDRWQKRIETSLNVEWQCIEPLIPYVDQWIIDIKDSNEEIYRRYTGISGVRVFKNIKKLSEIVGKERLRIRIPRIPDFNTETDVCKSAELYEEYGEIDIFSYRC